MNPELTPLNVAVVGATGMVGRTMLAVLEARNFPVATLLPVIIEAIVDEVTTDNLSDVR